jgi:hypothetical protein
MFVVDKTALRTEKKQYFCYFLLSKFLRDKGKADLKMFNSAPDTILIIYFVDNNLRD